MPDFSLERSAEGVVAGVDEAGRGPLAGPVVAAAVVLVPARIPGALLTAIDDSKRLARARREELFAALAACAAAGAARIGVSAASAALIDRMNVLGATMLAMERAVRRLPVRPSLVLVDGPFAPRLPFPVKTVVGGDRASLSIAAASIVAKVVRDRLMARLALLYPGFGWERNAGYGTKEHREAMIRLGITPHHRRTFSPVACLVSLIH